MRYTRSMKTPKAYVLHTDGRREEILPADGSEFSLPELQNIVGGYIEFIPSLEPGYFLVVNEEGKLLQLPPNESATNLSAYRERDIVLGDVLLCPHGTVS